MAKKKALPTKSDDGVYYCSAQITSTCANKKGLRPEYEMYKTHNEFFANGKLPICKECLYEMTHEDGVYIRQKLINILPYLDKPFLEDVLDMAENKVKEKNVGNVPSTYFRFLNLNHKDKRFIDSDGTLSEIMEKERFNSNPFDLPVTDRLRRKWGGTFEDYEIQFQESKYMEYENYYSFDRRDPSIVDTVKSICYIDLLDDKNKQNKKFDKDLYKEKQNLLKLANLTPAQRDANKDSWRVGEEIAKIEQHKPAEIIKKELFDVDGLKDRIERFKTHLMKMMGVSVNGNK